MAETQRPAAELAERTRGEELVESTTATVEAAQGVTERRVTALVDLDDDIGQAALLQLAT